jgi:23S rRNA (cytosine1962-C5)-methyltransferase
LTQSSEPSALPELRLRRGEDRRLRAGHPWIFSNEVDVAATPLTAFAPGQQVQVTTDRGQALGVAYVNPATLIAARLLARDRTRAVDAGWLAERLRSALARRERLAATPHYRWVFGESDGLPGLVLDRYGDVVVGQITTRGMDRLRAAVEQAVQGVLAPRALVWRNDSGARALEGLPEEVVTAFGDAPDRLEVVETLPGGPALRFSLPLADGQKTGWFYDQTFNRSLLGRFLAPDARVLDVCSYAGGWAATAAALGAGEITCIDSSAAALGRAVAHVAAARATPGAPATAQRGDAFEQLAELAEAGRRFDAVIVDPPAFIKRRKEFPQGVAAYRKLNQLALRVLEPEGLLVSCSCSYHLSADDLLGAIQGAARHVDRFVQVLHQGGQSPDHPVHPAVPETRYLKAFFCRVTRC